MKSMNGRNVFNCVLLLFLTILLVFSFRYKIQTRLAPLSIISATWLLSFLQLLTDAIPSCRAKFSFVYRGVDLEAPGGTAQAASPGKEDGRVVLRLFLWLTIFVVLLRYVYYLIPVGLFIFLVVRFEGKQSMRTSVIGSAGTLVFMYVLFNIILKARI